ncbi:SLATT domain-containing protein [Kitasatospora sp. NPDC058032]|uniref:SLATT domain-containing protein n=1 Tax=Kitasatospora sp. NPDC058032 TaxID=3346307 RepID=UPI0036DF076E
MVNTAGDPADDRMAGRADPRVTAAGDLRAVRLPDLSNAADLRVGLRELYLWVEAYAVESINWYTKEKVSKARWSKFLRVAAVLSIAGGTVTPVVAVGMGWAGESIWGYGLIGIGACFVAMDRVYGYSSAWMRYVSTAMALNRQLVRFQAAWPRIEARFAADPGQEGFAAAAQELSRFVDEFALVVENETMMWVAEFQSHLVQLESGAVPALPSQTSR